MDKNDKTRKGLKIWKGINLSGDDCSNKKNIYLRGVRCTHRRSRNENEINFLFFLRLLFTRSKLAETTVAVCASIGSAARLNWVVFLSFFRQILIRKK